MRLKKILFIAFIALLSVNNQAQNLYPSRVKIETKIADSTWYAVSGAGIVQVNEGSGEIALKMSIGTIETDVPSLDSALAQVHQKYLFFKGNFPVKNLSFSDSNNENNRDYSGKAFLTINGITKEVDYSCEVYNFDSDDEFDVGNNVYPLRIGLSFDFEPKDFNLNTYYKPLTNAVKIEVSNGFINKVNMGGDSIFAK